MKKLMCAVAALSAGICLADVTSANIVGYQTFTVAKNKYYALAVQFKDVKSSTTTMPIQNLITSSNPKGYTKLHSRADQIHVWTGMAWAKYYLNSNLNKFVKDGESVATEDTVKNGDTVFFLRSAQGGTADSITLPGEVNVVQSSVTVEVTKNKFHFISCPWPVDISVNDFKDFSSNPKGYTKLHSRADQVHRWTGMAWKKYYLNSNLNGYVLDGETAVTTDKIEAGEGVFFLRSAQGAVGDTITFAKPAGL